MKKQKILAVALGTIIGFGTIFGAGGAHADEAKKQKEANEITVEESVTCMPDELLEGSVLNKEEYKQYNEAINKIMSLYEDLEDKDLTDDIIEELEKAEQKIYEANQAVFDKVEKFYMSLEDAPHNMESNREDNEASPEEMQEEFYMELLEWEVLTPEELALFKEAEAKLNALYETDLEKINEEEFINRENTIYNEYKAVFEKVDSYYDTLIEKEEQEMIESGEFTKEQIEKMKLADQKVEELFNTLDENSSDEEVDKVTREIDRIYEELGF